MIEIDNELFKMYSSLERLESLDKHYYKNSNFNFRINRQSLRNDIINSVNIDIFNIINNNIHNYNKKELNTLPLYDYLIDRVGALNLVTTYRYIDSFRKKTIRIRKRISCILEYDNVYFLTFTFDNRKFKKDFNSIKYDTLRKYVTRWLKKYSLNYVGNIDFGGKNGRVHFHCVCSSTLNSLDRRTWKYGAMNIKRINNKNSKALALYVNKLCSHAIKESTKNQYLIYPKKS